HPHWVTSTRTSPTTGTIRWSSEPSENVDYYYFGLHPTTTMFTAPAYCDPNWNYPGGGLAEQTLESPGVYEKDVGALDPTKDYYAYVAAVELIGWSWSAYSSWEPPINNYDYPENVVTVINPDLSIEVLNGDANNVPVPVGIPGPYPNPVAVPSYTATLEMIGAGPWTVNYYTTSPIGIWYSYVTSSWTIVHNVAGQIVFNIPAGGKDLSEVPIALGDETLPVTLSSFTASLTASNFVSLAWTSESETNLLGYRVYRTDNQNFAQAIMITPTLIPATNTSNVSHYSHEDHEVVINNTYWYWLESVEPAAEEMHGPISIYVADGNSDTPVIPETT
ncbi:MAG: hypothetical protein PHO32_10570, partial [Candidatus Cloacimonetes bacterium]|nr:hypothetical protein [Candidatus Cloacimonadota bacterium]